jgi:hypothetical protein
VPVAAAPAPAGTATVEIVRGNSGQKYEVKRVSQSVRVTRDDSLGQVVGRAK